MMKKVLVICLVMFGAHYLIACGQQQSPQVQPSTKADSVNADKNSVASDTIKKDSSIEYLSYQGTATDDGNITGKNTKDEFHLFKKNDTKNIVYVISRFNYGLWSSEKIMPAELKPLIQIYKIDIPSKKKLINADNTVEYYEITKLNSMVETDEME